MLDWLTYTLALIPWILILASWIHRYRSGRLRIRYMGLTAAVGSFISLGLPAVLFAASGETSGPLGEMFLTVLVASILFGATFLAWWPILRKGLSKKGILW